MEPKYHNMHTNLIILAGGASSRMKKSIPVEGLTEEEIHTANTKNKALITYGKDGRPILDFLLLNAEKAGYKNVCIIVGKRAEDFKKYYGLQEEGNVFKGMTISYATQHIPEGREKPYGTTDAVVQALQQYPHLQQETFTVCNCDNLYSVEALKLLRETKAPNAFISYDRDALKFSEERIARFALARLDSDHNMLEIVEKPSAESIAKFRDSQGKFRVSMNIFKFDAPMMFPYLKTCPPHPERDEKELPTAIVNFCKDHPKQFLGIPLCEHVPDLTSKEDIKVFKQYLRDHF